MTKDQEEALQKLSDIHQEIERMETERGITPDCWVVIEFDKKWQKVVAGWGGSYLYGDSWRISSPIVEFTSDDTSYLATTESGSTYILKKTRQGLRMSNAGVYNQLKEKFGDKIELIELP